MWRDLHKGDELIITSLISPRSNRRRRRRKRKGKTKKDKISLEKGFHLMHVKN